MNVTFLEIAEIELEDSIEFYNLEKPGLGDEFLDEILQTIKRIASYPEAAVRCSERCRRCLVRRFPYGVIYQARESEILIVAIAHLHRKPEFWQDRI